MAPMDIADRRRELAGGHLRIVPFKPRLDIDTNKFAWSTSIPAKAFAECCSSAVACGG